MTVAFQRFSIPACIGILIAACAFMAILLAPSSVSAIDCTDENNSTKVGCEDTALTECLQDGSNNCDLIRNYVNPIIVLLTVLVGLAVTIGIILGGIGIASAGGDPNKLAAGKQKVYAAITALIFFGLLWAFLNWIIPGGIGV